METDNTNLELGYKIQPRETMRPFRGEIRNMRSKELTQAGS